MDASHLRHQAKKGFFVSFFLRTQLLLLLVIANCGALVLESTRDYLQRQLVPHAQNTANSLALSLQPHLSEGKLLTAKTIITALVQSGEYREIILREENGNPLIQKDTSSVALDLPDWFVRWLAFTPPMGEAQIIKGWEVIATIEVVSHPGLAYLQLWRLFSGLVGLAIAGVALSLVMAWLMAQRQARVFDALERKLRMELLEHYLHIEEDTATKQTEQKSTTPNNISAD